MLIKTLKIAGLLLFLLIASAIYWWYSSYSALKSINAGLSVQPVIITDQHSDRKLKATIWQAVDRVNAKPVGFHGVILVSHGFSSHSQSLALYSADLAKAGYLVAAVTHPDIKGIRTGIAERDPLVAREKQLRQLYYHLLDLYQEESIADLPVGLIGYSMGGLSVLQLAGYRLDLSLQEQHCANTDYSKKQSVLLCSPAISKRIAKLKSLKTPGSDQSTQLNTPHIKAVALLSPGYTELVDLTRQPEGDLSMLIVASANDEYINNKQIASFGKDINASVETHILAEAGHYVHLRKCPIILGKLLEICRDPKPVDRLQIQRETSKLLQQYFDREIRSL